MFLRLNDSIRALRVVPVFSRDRGSERASCLRIAPPEGSPKKKKASLPSLHTTTTTSADFFFCSRSTRTATANNTQLWSASASSRLPRATFLSHPSCPCLSVVTSSQVHGRPCTRFVTSGNPQPAGSLLHPLPQPSTTTTTTTPQARPPSPLLLHNHHLDHHHNSTSATPPHHHHILTSSLPCHAVTSSPSHSCLSRVPLLLTSSSTLCPRKSLNI